MTRVLITGSTSVIARAIGKRLSTTRQIFYAGKTAGDYHLDLESGQNDIPENAEFDVVIHAAADFGGETEESIFRCENVNALGTLRVCQLARKFSAKHLVVISSISACYKAGDPYYTIYALSKKHAEDLAGLYATQFHLPLTILRPTQIYDAHADCRKHQPLLYSVIDKAANGGRIQFFGTHDARRNYLFLDDFAEVVARTVDGRETGIFNCAYPKSVTLREIATSALATYNRQDNIEFDHTKPDIADLPFIPDDFPLYKLIAYTPGTDLATGIKLIKQARSL